MVAESKRPFEISVESAQMFNYDGNPNRYYFSTQMLSLAWEPFRPLELGPARIRMQMLSTIFTAAILRGPETFYLGWGPQLRFIVPLGDSPWSLYAGGGAGLGYANANSNAREDHGLGQQLTFILLSSGGVRYALSDRWSAWMGAMWHHLSNGDLSEPKKPNVGPDELGVVVGMGWSF